LFSFLFERTLSSFSPLIGAVLLQLQLLLLSLLFFSILAAKKKDKKKERKGIITKVF